MLTFLHISDLHFTTEDAGTQFDRDAKIREALLADLGIDGRSGFDGILVSGDITYNGRAEEFTRAGEWLEKLRVVVGCSPESLFVVPGNHDVNRDTVSRDSSLWELHQRLRAPMPLEQMLSSLEKKLHDPFDFLTAMAEYRAFAAAYQCPTNPKELAWTQLLDKHTLEDGTRVRVHGLNSALISDGEDQMANLLLGEFQFHHLNGLDSCVNIVICHHPHTWLLDGKEANDFFRTQAQVVLCGHDHDPRIYVEDRSLRVFAGAVHPNRRETKWEPCYHVLRLSLPTGSQRLLASVETRVWRVQDKYFVPYPAKDGTPHQTESIPLPSREPSASQGSTIFQTQKADIPVSSASGKAVAPTPTNELMAAAKRRLIVHFFRLGAISKYTAVVSAGVWEEGDDALDGQARWARVFDRAEKAGKLGALWDAIAAQDETLIGQPNPFTNGD